MRARNEIPVDVVKEVVRRLQENGAVDFSHRDGVRCPACTSQLAPGAMGVTRAMGWDGTVRERYHKCPKCGARFKSVEVC